MPFYQFTVPADSPSTGLKADIATAVTRVHTEVTGAPARYVSVSFHEVPPGSIFAAGEQVSQGRLVGIIRSGRTQEIKRVLITGLATAWSEVTGEPMEGFALFILDRPGSNIMDEGHSLLPLLVAGRAV
ncbi:MAG TPA: tautomerase family protein [Rubrobacteraceae bacterium]|nr:tautomerase family protein [Rubrobacteraceae bacterium]